MSQNIKPLSVQQMKSLEAQKTCMTYEAAMDETNLLFCRMTGIFGQAWLQNFPTSETLKSSKVEWAKQLQRFTVLDIERAIQAVIDSGDKFPPNLPVFVKHLKDKPEQRRIYGA